MYLCNRKQNSRRHWSDPLFLLLLWFSYTWWLISCWVISVDLWRLFYCDIMFTFPLLTLLDRNKQLHVLKQSCDQHPSPKVLHYRISLHPCWVSLQSSFCELSTLISLLLWRLKSCLLLMLSKYSLLVWYVKSFYYHLPHLKIITVVLGFIAVMQCYVRISLVMIYWITFKYF